MTVPNDDTRQRILNAAGEAFSEKGFQATTVREICRRAGVNLAAVNYHFGDKDRLYQEAIRHAHTKRTAQVPMPEWSADTPAEVRLREFIMTMATRLVGEHEQAWHHDLMMREVLHPTAATRSLVEDFIGPHFRMLLGILSELVPPETPQSVLYRLGFSVVGQCLFYRFNQEIIGILKQPDDDEAYLAPERIADHVTRVMLSALGSGTAFENQSGTLPADNNASAGSLPAS